MARTPNLTQAAPERQQMDRSNDPQAARRMDEAAPAEAMRTQRQHLTGEATGVGSVAYDDPGAFDVGAGARPLEGRVIGPPVDEGHDPDTSVEESRLRDGGVGPGASTGGPDPRTQRLQDDSGFDRENRDADQDEPLSGEAR